MMTTMIAKTLPYYGTKVLKTGDRFDVEDESHVRVLEVTGKAERAPDEPEDTKRKYRRRDMTASGQ